MFHSLSSRMRSSRAAASVLLALAGSSGCGDSDDINANTEADIAADVDAADDGSEGPADTGLPDAILDSGVEDGSGDGASADGSGDAALADSEVDAVDAVDEPDTDGSRPINRGAPDINIETITGFSVEPLTYTVPGLGTERTLDVHLWYPTADTEGETARFYLFSDRYALDGATVAPGGPEPAPLLLYSHGGRGFSGQISTVARQFVRNGWIVVAPSHPGDNLFDYDESQPYSFSAIRAFDILEALDWVENLPADHPLRGRIDTSRVLVMGHSYGGQNTWILNGLAFDLDGLRARCGDGCTDADLEAYEAFAPDSRIVAGVSLDCTFDANLLPDSGYANVEAPMLHISGTEGNHAAAFFERAAAADLTWVSLIGGCHESITGTLPCSTLPRDEGIGTAAAYAIAFGTRHVLGSTAPAVLGILDGSVEVSANAEVRRTARAE